MPAVHLSDGLYELRASDPRLDELVAKLNALLMGQKLVQVYVDTSSIFPMPQMTYGQLSYEKSVHIRNERLAIPIGLWIELSLRPLTFEGRDYASGVDILGDHVGLRIPYFFHETPQRVDFHLYSLVRLRPLE